MVSTSRESFTHEISMHGADVCSHRLYLLRFRVWPNPCSQRWTTIDTHRPVIVAENMIGCAMYELVCRIASFAVGEDGLTIFGRFGSGTTTSLEK